MPRFHRKKITADAAGRKHGWRSGLEKKMQDKLQELGIDDNYESKTFEYIVPETKHKYTPDFPVSPHIVIETKGYKGWILGRENGEYWTQTIYKSKHQFYNPIKQNAGHVRFLHHLLKCST